MCMTYIYRCTSCHETVKSIVELDECPYCGFSAWLVPVKKYKSIEKKIQGWQDKVIEPRKRTMKKDILKKVKKLEEKDYYIQRCLRVRVCPGCGRNISSKEAIGTFFNCECGFST